MKLTNLPDNVLYRIFDYFQDSRYMDTSSFINRDFINRERLKLDKVKIKTNVKTIVNIASTNKRFNKIIFDSKWASLFWAVYYNSLFDIKKKYYHTRYCDVQNCNNICHYFNNNVKHTNLINKISKKTLNTPPINNSYY